MAGTITFKKGHDVSIPYLSHGPSLSAIQTYASQLLPYTTARITEVTVTFREFLENTEKPGEYGSTDLYAQIFIKDIENDKKFAIILPAPISSIFENTGHGYRVNQGMGELLTSYYAQLSGLQLEFDEGWLCGEGQ